MIKNYISYQNYNMLPNLWQQIHSGLKGSCLWLHLPPGWPSKRSSKDSEHLLHSIGKYYYFTYRLNSYIWFPASHRAHDLLFIIRVFLRHKLDRRTSAWSHICTRSFRPTKQPKFRGSTSWPSSIPVCPSYFGKQIHLELFDSLQNSPCLVLVHLFERTSLVALWEHLLIPQGSH